MFPENISNFQLRQKRSYGLRKLTIFEFRKKIEKTSL